MSRCGITRYGALHHVSTFACLQERVNPLLMPTMCDVAPCCLTTVPGNCMHNQWPGSCHTMRAHQDLNACKHCPRIACICKPCNGQPARSDSRRHVCQLVRVLLCAQIVLADMQVTDRKHALAGRDQTEDECCPQRQTEKVQGKEAKGSA